MDTIKAFVRVAIRANGTGTIKVTVTNTIIIRDATQRVFQGLLSGKQHSLKHIRFTFGCGGMQAINEGL